MFCLYRQNHSPVTGNNFVFLVHHAGLWTEPIISKHSMDLWRVDRLQQIWLNLHLLSNSFNWTRIPYGAINADFKAFDKVMKRGGMNINTLNWIRSYLSNRYLHVKFGKHKSRRILTISGVPYGTFEHEFVRHADNKIFAKIVSL